MHRYIALINATREAAVLFQAENRFCRPPQGWSDGLNVICTMAAAIKVEDYVSVTWDVQRTSGFCHVNGKPFVGSTFAVVAHRWNRCRFSVRGRQEFP